MLWLDLCVIAALIALFASLVYRAGWDQGWSAGFLDGHREGRYFSPALIPPLETSTRIREGESGFRRGEEFRPNE